MFNCKKCGACCRYHNCKHLTKDNLCSIYERRPDRCNVKKMAERSGIEEKEYYKLTTFACNVLRTKECIDELVKTFFDGKYKDEREKFRRDK